MFSLFREQKGSIAVLTAISLSALVGFSAIVIDIGILYMNRSQLINMADAAALAGVQELPGRSDAAQAVAADYAARNGKAGDTVETELANNYTEITVSASRDVTLFFSRIFNSQTSKLISASATAAVRPMSSVNGAVPFGVVKQDFIFGLPYTLKEGDGDNGNYGGLALGGNGANTYRYNIKYGYDGKLHVGQWVPTEPGNMSGPTNQGVNYRISQDPGATFETVSKDSPRIVMVPVLDHLNVNGRGDVQIVGFAAFFLEGTGGSGSDSYVTGKFMQLVAAGDVTSDPAADYGLYSAMLVK